MTFAPPSVESIILSGAPTPTHGLETSSISEAASRHNSDAPLARLSYASSDSQDKTLCNLLRFAERVKSTSDGLVSSSCFLADQPSSYVDLLSRTFSKSIPLIRDSSRLTGRGWTRKCGWVGVVLAGHIVWSVGCHISLARIRRRLMKIREEGANFTGGICGQAEV